MADPFGVLRAPVTPADPGPAFAARLRARLERALALPEGVAMSQASTQAGQAAPAPARRQGDIGYASLWVGDAERAAAFYAAVLGWEYAPGHDPGGRLARSSSPSQGLRGGQPRSTLFCSYVVDEAEAAVRRVRAAGGRAGDPVRRPYGLSADCTDDQGFRFAVHQPPATGPGEPATAGAAHDGDLSYVTLEMPDADRARDFYASVLGWRLAPGGTTGWQVVGTVPPVGIMGGCEVPTGVPVWQVSDVISATGRVRAAGGTAGEPHQEPYGLIAECSDDQGTRFALVQHPG